MLLDLLIGSSATGFIDVRARLPRADWIIGRRAATTSITVHYNGPELPDFSQQGFGLIAQLQADARYQMRPGWGGTKNGAPGLMYHFVVSSTGVIYQARDIDEILWHCAHQDGNSGGLAVHFPLGGQQDATSYQWARGEQLIDALRERYNIPLARVYGHIEWKHATLCPGRLQPRVVAYRAGLTPHVPATVLPAGVSVFQVKQDLTAPARIRQGPGESFAIAGRYKPGTKIYIDPPVDSKQAVDGIYHAGEPINGDPRWVHLARVENEQADLGFISATLVRELA